MSAANEDVEVEGIEVIRPKQLSGKRVASKAADGFEQAEPLDPKAKPEVFTSAKPARGRKARRS